LTYAPSLTDPPNKTARHLSGGPRLHSTTTRQPETRLELRLFELFELRFAPAVIMRTNLSSEPSIVNLQRQRDAWASPGVTPAGPGCSAPALAGVSLSADDASRARHGGV